MKTFSDFVTKVFQKALGKVQASEAQASEAQAAEASDWISTLPRSDSLASMGIINEHLAALAHDETLSDENRINTLLSIDNGSHDIIASIENQYITIRKLSPEIDRRMWESMQTYHHYLALGYQSHINKYIEHPDRVLQDEHQLPVMVIRALNSIYQSMKLRYLRYQSVIAEDWKRMHTLYRIAERAGFANKPVEVYPELPEYSFCERYILALMMDTLNHSMMSKKQIGQVEVWLSHWLKGATIESDFDESRFLFYTDLDKGCGAYRIRSFKPTPSCRYWETDKIVALIGQAKQTLNEGHNIEKLGLLQSDSRQASINLLEYLYSEWSRTEYRRQRRGSDRSSIMRTANVVYGFQPVLLMVKDFSAGKSTGDGYGVALSLEETDKSKSASKHAPIVLFPEISGERWTLSDQSEKGFGANVLYDSISSVSIGTLVAFVCDDQRDILTLGVIRSIKDMDIRHFHVGIEVFSQKPIYMELVNTTFWKDTGDVYKDATLLVSPFAILQTLYLRPDAAFGTRASLIVPSIKYEPKDSFTLKIGNDVHTVQYGDIIEQKNDWIRVYAILDAPTV